MTTCLFSMDENDLALEAAAAALPIHLKDRGAVASSILALTGTEEEILEALNEIEVGLVDRYLEAHPQLQGEGARIAARIYGKIPDLAMTFWKERNP